MHCMLHSPTGEHSVGGNAARRAVQGQLPNGDAHSVSPQIPLHALILRGMKSKSTTQDHQRQSTQVDIKDHRVDDEKEQQEE